MKMFSIPNWTRRQLLQATAFSAGLTPLVPTNALSALPRKRVIFVYTPLGAPYEQWAPSGCGFGIQLSAASSTLEPAKHHCVFLNNLDVEDGGLGVSRKVLGGGYTEARKTTLDILLGEALSENVQIPNLHLGAFATHPSEVVSAKDYNQIAFMRSSATVYEALLHTEGVAANTPLDKKFRAEMAAGPTTDFHREVDLQIELSALALSRNVTNVITLMWVDQEGGMLLPQSIPGLSGGGFHQAVHSSREAYATFRAYLSAKLTYLIQLLEVIRDENNLSLLDTTLVVHVTDQGDGDSHASENAPYFIAGCKSLFRSGVVLSVAQDAIAEAYGLQGVNYGTKKIEGLMRV